MNTKKLLVLRKAAERTVADMPDGELKVKAFEVILAHMMQEVDSPAKPSRRAAKATSNDGDTVQRANKTSTVGRILVLREEGFFKNPKSIAEVCDELASHGWHYPQSALSGPLQTSVQRRELRRKRESKGNKKIWVYSEH